MFEAELVWGDSAVGILVLIRQSCHYNVNQIILRSMCSLSRTLNFKRDYSLCLGLYKLWRR